MNVKEITESVRQRLLDLSGRLGSRKAAVEELSGHGISSSWMLKFMNGEISNPTVESIATLQRVLAAYEEEKAA